MVDNSSNGRGSDLLVVRKCARSLSCCGLFLDRQRNASKRTTRYAAVRLSTKARPDRGRMDIVMDLLPTSPDPMAERIDAFLLRVVEAQPQIQPRDHMFACRSEECSKADLRTRRNLLLG